MALQVSLVSILQEVEAIKKNVLSLKKTYAFGSVSNLGHMKEKKQFWNFFFSLQCLYLCANAYTNVCLIKCNRMQGTSKKDYSGFSKASKFMLGLVTFR